MAHFHMLPAFWVANKVRSRHTAKGISQQEYQAKVQAGRARICQWLNECQFDNGSEMCAKIQNNNGEAKPSDDADGGRSGSTQRNSESHALEPYQSPDAMDMLLS